jgi:sulfate adenylyltransferase subunit 1
VKAGDTVTVLPSRKQSKVKSIIVAGESASEAFAGQAVTLTLKDEIDISRGDMIVHSGAEITVSNALKAQLIWMSENELQPGREYWFKFASKLTSGSVRAIDYKVNVNTQEHSPASSLGLNDIAVIDVTLNQPVVADPYLRNRATGAFIMIDRLSNVTVAGGMVIEALQSTLPEKAGKSSLRNEVQALLQQSLDDAGLAEALKKLLGGGSKPAKTAKPKSGKNKTKSSKKTPAKTPAKKTKAKLRK